VAVSVRIAQKNIAFVKLQILRSLSAKVMTPFGEGGRLTMKRNSIDNGLVS